MGLAPIDEKQQSPEAGANWQHEGFEALPCREIQTLVCCGRLHMNGEERTRLRALLGADVRWQSLLDLAKWHGMVPLLYSHVHDNAADLVPRNVVEQLHALTLLNAARNLQWTNELLEILRLFGQHGLTGIPYKGPAIASRAYGNVALREWCDLDVLVRPADFQMARQLLLERGYHSRHVLPPGAEAFVRKRFHSEVFVQAGECTIELHWAFARRAIAPRFDLDDMFRRLSPITIAGETVLGISDEEMLLILAVHGGKHRWQRLEWLVAYAQLIRATKDTAKWEEVAKRARVLRRERVLHVAVLLAHEVLDAPVPAELLARARQQAQVRGLVGEIRRPLLDGGAPFSAVSSERAQVDWFQLRMLESGWDKLRFLIDRSTTPRRAEHSNLLRFGGRILPVEAFVRPARVIGKLGESGWRRARDRMNGRPTVSSARKNGDGGE